MDALRVPRTAQRVRGLLIHRQLANLQVRPGCRNRLADLELELLAHLTQLRDQILPLAHAQETQVFGFADAAQRGIAGVAVRLEHTVPQIQRRQKVAGGIRVAVVDAVGLLTVLIRPFTRILQTQERHHDQYRGQCVRRGGLRGFDDHTAKTHIDRNAGQLASGMCQHNLAMLACDGLQFGQFVETIGHGLHVRRVDKAEIRHVLRGARHAHRQHMQHNRAQRCAQNLGFGEFRTRFEVLTRIQANRDAVGDASATARTLIRARLANRLNRKPLHLRRLRIT